MKKMTTDDFEVQAHGTGRTLSFRILTDNQPLSPAQAEAQLKTALTWVQGQTKANKR
jgi:hypothetical protein